MWSSSLKAFRIKVEQETGDGCENYQKNERSSKQDEIEGEKERVEKRKRQKSFKIGNGWTLALKRQNAEKRS